MRCARDCEDKVRDRITPDMKSLPKELEDELTSCATQCSKQYTSLVPQLFKKLDDYVKEATKHELWGGSIRTRRHHRELLPSLLFRCYINWHNFYVLSKWLSWYYGSIKRSIINQQVDSNRHGDVEIKFIRIMFF